MAGAARAAELGFELRLQKALERARAVLDNSRHPAFPSGVDHRYEDKYLLVERATASAAASQLNCLAALGLSSEQLLELRRWAEKHTVFLRFHSRETCAHLREQKREVEAPSKHVVEGSLGGVRASLTSKVVTTVEEHMWSFDATYEFLFVRGTGAGGAEDELRLAGRSCQREVVTSAKATPYPSAVVPIDTQLDVSWLLKHVCGDPPSPSFKVDRSAPRCHTPRRNADVEGAERHFGAFRRWSEQVCAYLVRLASEHGGGGSSLARCTDELRPFVPVLPVLEASSSSEAEPVASAAATAAGSGLLALLPSGDASDDADKGAGDLGRVLAGADVNALLAEEQRSLGKLWSTAESMASSSSPSSKPGPHEEVFAATWMHCSQVCLRWLESVDYIEDLLRHQLVAAIGKEVTPADFAQYMTFHSRKVFTDAHTPVPFCFAVRRSECQSPEGTVSIEEKASSPGGDSNIAAPIATLTARSPQQQQQWMEFPISASTKVRFGGERHVHAWLSHRFSGQPAPSLSLVAKARQFSSMLVLVGRITSAHSFDPKYAAIVQNKDELTIPLELSTLPTPKEFKDAIASLSPEQQSFAKAFRAMQLESTLFAVLVVQIRPQLERVLNLDDGSLTKEIKLTQELMKLFIEYQISSDLLSFDEASTASTSGKEASPAQRLGAVREHVRAMQEMVELAKQEELEERRKEAEYETGKRRQQEEEVRHLRDMVELERRREQDSGINSDESEGDDCGRNGDEDLMLDRCESLEREAMCLSAAPPSPPSGSGLFGRGGFLKAAADTLTGRSMKSTSAKSANFGELEFAEPPPPMAPGGPAQCESISLSASKSASAPSSSLIMAPPRPKPTAVKRARMAQSCDKKRSRQTDPEGGQQDPAKEAQEPSRGGSSASTPPTIINVAERSERDYAKLPSEMDDAFGRLDPDSALRPTIIGLGETWTRRAQKALLAKPTTEILGSDEQKREKDAAFDLLDALTKSGALPLEHASLHVLVAATHCFDRTVLETVVQENCNPIEKVERSLFIMAGVVHQLPPAALARGPQLPRLAATSPALFPELHRDFDCALGPTEPAPEAPVGGDDPLDFEDEGGAGDQESGGASMDLLG